MNVDKEKRKERYKITAKKINTVLQADGNN
jgi:hypothetical protein